MRRVEGALTCQGGGGGGEGEDGGGFALGFVVDGLGKVYFDHFEL